jgi:cupin fold WbuC family metalloprotein
MGSGISVFSTQLLSDLSVRAKASPRLRQHYNLHGSYEEPSQRLLIAMEPGSYIRPHRHLRDPKPECFIGIRGRFALITFDDDGRVETVVPFGPREDAAGADLPVGVWHTLVCLEEGSVFFETKPGPFNPVFKKDLAPWAPEEGGEGAEGYLVRLVGLVG